MAIYVIERSGYRALAVVVPEQGLALEFDTDDLGSKDPRPSSGDLRRTSDMASGVAR
jgi:hypothetical protein